METLQSHIQSFDSKKLLEYWTFLESRLFSKLPVSFEESTKTLQAAMCKCYMVSAYQSSKTEKVHEFLERHHSVVEALPLKVSEGSYEATLLLF